MIKLMVKELAKQRGLQQKQLAEQSGVNVTVLGRYWNNHTGMVSLDVLARIARALGVSVKDLFEDEDKDAA